MSSLPRSLCSFASLVLLLPLVSSCGLILGGSFRQTIPVASVLDGATFTTSPPTSTYTTPASLTLDRRNDYTLTFEKPGYTNAAFGIRSKARTGYVIADLLLTGLLGLLLRSNAGLRGSRYRVICSPAVKNRSAFCRPGGGWFT